MSAISKGEEKTWKKKKSDGLRQLQTRRHSQLKRGGSTEQVGFGNGGGTENKERTSLENAHFVYRCHQREGKRKKKPWQSTRPERKPPVQTFFVSGTSKWRGGKMHPARRPRGNRVARVYTAVKRGGESIETLILWGKQKGGREQEKALAPIQL